MTSSSSRCGETQAEGYTDISSAFYSDGNNSFINGGGNLGVGTTNPQSKLDVAGDHTFQIPGLTGSAAAEATLRNARLAGVLAADFIAEAARR